ncbi:15-hydroxyprostaglandin dehydrogenase [NAD(+)]-like [Lingula anatina]|uniref:15-hydroxyprostaglandin dehydrogenase [NAD(+)] n=1 Tax=Lingula anatina TaxID=7574 RepID=A0A1S3JH91_LINAN|nr:15-hydroxyprostaglandin dehydrogenase [NAD(+)]-like [Lingula anatina]|eukprot:XP_013409728.1 15-hydroxyprostaglandin dehydrogenase [NAD(+)]-like [Lingula anatina]
MTSSTVSLRERDSPIYKENVQNVFIQTKSHFGRVDIVVNNAGIFDENDVKKCTSVNLNSVICGTMLGVEHMRKNKEGGEGGVVVNMASTAGLQPYPLIPVYTATKHGIVGYTRCWGANPDFPYQQVRVNCLCPHLTNTSLLQLTPEQKAAGVVRHVRLWEAWYPMAMKTALRCVCVCVCAIGTEKCFGVL